MMQGGLSLINASAIWALLSMLIPLLIHLFNRSRGRLVKIGHIDLVRQAKQHQVTEVRLSQWLLLALRLCIFTLLGLLLAGLSSSNVTVRQPMEIYLSPAWLGYAGQDDINHILELAASEPGSTIQLLAPDYPRVDQDWLARRHEQPIAVSNIWPLLLEKLESENHQGPVQVFATDFASQFGNNRPALPRPVNWNLSHPVAPPAADYRPFHALIAYQDDRVTEAKRLESVFAVIRKYRLPSLTWESMTFSRFGDSDPGCDWLILLTDKHKDWTKRVKTPLVVMSINGQSFEERKLEYIDVPFYPWSRFGLRKISETAVGTTQNDEGTQWQVLLKTSQGEPLLQQQRIGRVSDIQLNSRLDPAWNSLIQQAEFPELFLQLLLDDDTVIKRYPDARVSIEALQDHHALSPVDTRAQIQPLHQILALILVLLWILERWLSERRPREAL